MSTTTFVEGSATRTWGGHSNTRCPEELLERYQEVIAEQRLSWTEHHRLIRLLGSGGQGVVYLSERRGTDKFTLPVAIKIFSPERYATERAWLPMWPRFSRTTCWMFTTGWIAIASA